MVGRPLAQNPERGVREEKKARYFNMEHGWHTHCLLFLGHVNVKSGFLDCSCLIDLVWKGLPRCQVKLSWIGCWQLSASSSIYDFPRSLRWTGAMLISWFFVLRCYVRFHRRNHVEKHEETNSGWWFQPLWKILVNGKDYPIYYGKLKMIQPPASVPRMNSSRMTCQKRRTKNKQLQAKATANIPQTTLW